MKYFNGTDDQEVIDQQVSFLGGQVSFARQNLLGPAQASILWNLDVETNGTTKTRRGWHALGDLFDLTGSTDLQGLHWFSAPGYQYLLAVVDGDLCKMTSAGVWNIVDSATLAAGEPVWFAQVNDRVFACVASTGRIKWWTGANLASNAAGTAITDGPAKAKHLVSQRYRLFALDAATDDSIHASTYLPTGTTPFAIGATAMFPFRVGEGEGGKVTVIHPWKGATLIVAKESSLWQVDTSGTPVATSTGWTDTLATSNFVVTRLSSQIGCVAHRTMATVGNDVLFLSRDGVRSVAKTVEDGDGEISEAISTPIDDIIQRINWAAVDTACACAWNGRYLLAVPLDTASQPDHVLVFNQRTGGWYVWTGVSPLEFAVTQFTSNPQTLVALEAGGQVIEFQDYTSWTSTTSDHYRDDLDGDGTYAKPGWRVQTRAFTWEVPTHPKLPDWVEIEFDKSAAFVDVWVYLDGDNGGKVAKKYDTGEGGPILPVVLPFVLGSAKVIYERWSVSHLGECREMAVEIREAENLSTSEEDESGPVAIRTVRAGAYLSTIGDEI